MQGPAMVLLYFAALRDLRPPSSATTPENFVWHPDNGSQPEVKAELFGRIVRVHL